MLDDSGNKREAYHLYEAPNQAELISGDRGQRNSDVGRGPSWEGPEGICWGIGNRPYFDLNDVSLTVETCQNSLSCTLKIYVLYCMYVIAQYKSK